MVMLYVYLCFMLRLTLVAGQSAYYVLKGKEAILTPALPKHPDDILWKHNGDKVITFDSSEERVFEPYSNRVTLSWDTAQLAITNLRYEDSGEYELDAIISERLYRSQYMLKVLDEVSKPVIRCEINDQSSDGNNTSATLFCSSESNTPEVLTFKWNLEGKSHLGHTLPIALGNEHDDAEYSCTANNPLQKETTVFRAKDCYTEKTSESLDILIPIIIALLLLLAFGLFIFIFRHQIKRACSNIRNNNDLEKQLNRAVEKKAESVKSEDERVPLMESNIHRQETIPSSQKLPKQEGVDETPLGIVQNIRKNFEAPKNTETHTGERSRSQPSFPSSSGPEPAPQPDPMVSGELNVKHDEPNVSNLEEAGNRKSISDEDNNELAPETPSPNSEAQVNKDLELRSEAQDSDQKSDKLEDPGSSGSDPSGQDESKALEQIGEGNDTVGRATSQPGSPEHRQEQTGSGERNVQHEAPNVSKPEGAEDAESNHSEQNKPEDTQEPQSPSSEAQVNQGLQPSPDHPHKDREGDQKMDPGPSSFVQLGKGYVKSIKKKIENSGITETHTGKGNDNGVKATSEPGSPSSSVPKPAPPPGQMGSEELNLQHKEPNGSRPEGAEDANSNHSDQDTFEDAHKPQSSSSEAQVNQGLQPPPEEQESSVMTDSDQKSDKLHKDREGDQKMDPGPSSFVQLGKVESKVPEQIEPQSSNSEPQVNQGLQPTPEEQESSGKTNSHQKSDESHKDDESHSDESQKAPEMPEPQPAVSTSDEDQTLHSGTAGVEGKGHEVSNSAGEEPQKQESFKTPGSGEQVDESTHPPASSLSQHADNKETKDTDGEHTEDANPLHVKETKDKTNKESDSPGSGQRNGADASKVEKQDEAVDDEKSNT